MRFAKNKIKFLPKLYIFSFNLKNKIALEVLFVYEFRYTTVSNNGAKTKTLQGKNISDILGRVEHSTLALTVTIF